MAARVVCGGVTGWWGQAKQKDYWKVQENLGVGVIDMFTILILVMVSQVYKGQNLINFKYVQFITHPFYLN